MSDDFINTMRKIGFTVITMPDDGSVLCDQCNKDYTTSDEKGGFLFNSNAVCPDCAPKFEESAKAYKEEHYIRARAKEGESFGDFVRRIR
jgi:uncharacterized Zn ribbon protein